MGWHVTHRSRVHWGARQTEAGESQEGLPRPLEVFPGSGAGMGQPGECDSKDAAELSPEGTDAGDKALLLGESSFPPSHPLPPTPPSPPQTDSQSILELGGGVLLPLSAI